MVNESVRWHATALLRGGGDQMVTQFYERLMANLPPWGRTTENSFFFLDDLLWNAKQQRTQPFCPLHEFRSFHLELSANAVNEELPAVFPRIHQSQAADLRPHAANDVLHLIIWEQVRNLSLNEWNQPCYRHEDRGKQSLGFLCERQLVKELSYHVRISSDTELGKKQDQCPERSTCSRHLTVWVEPWLQKGCDAVYTEK